MWRRRVGFRMLSAWRAATQAAYAWPVYAVYAPRSASLHTSACVLKKSGSKYAKFVLLNARKKRKDKAKEKAASASKAPAHAREEDKKEGKVDTPKAPAPKTPEAPAPRPPPKVVAFPRPHASSKLAPRPTSFLHGDEARKARLVRLEEFRDEKGPEGERAGSLSASNVSIESTYSVLTQLYSRCAKWRSRHWPTALIALCSSRSCY